MHWMKKYKQAGQFRVFWRSWTKEESFFFYHRSNEGHMSQQNTLRNNLLNDTGWKITASRTVMVFLRSKTHCDEREKFLWCLSSDVTTHVTEITQWGVSRQIQGQCYAEVKDVWLCSPGVEMLSGWILFVLWKRFVKKVVWIIVVDWRIYLFIYLCIFLYICQLYPIQLSLKPLISQIFIVMCYCWLIYLLIYFFIFLSIR